MIQISLSGLFVAVWVFIFLLLLIIVSLYERLIRLSREYGKKEGWWMYEWYQRKKQWERKAWTWKVREDIKKDL